MAPSPGKDQVIWMSYVILKPSVNVYQAWVEISFGVFEGICSDNHK